MHIARSASFAYCHPSPASTPADAVDSWLQELCKPVANSNLILISCNVYIMGVSIPTPSNRVSHLVQTNVGKKCSRCNLYHKKMQCKTFKAGKEKEDEKDEGNNGKKQKHIEKDKNKNGKKISGKITHLRDPPTQWHRCAGAGPLRRPAGPVSRRNHCAGHGSRCYRCG